MDKATLCRQDRIFKISRLAYIDSGGCDYGECDYGGLYGECEFGGCEYGEEDYGECDPNPNP